MVLDALVSSTDPNVYSSHVHVIKVIAVCRIVKHDDKPCVTSDESRVKK